MEYLQHFIHYYSLNGTISLYCTSWGVGVLHKKKLIIAIETILFVSFLGLAQAQKCDKAIDLRTRQHLEWCKITKPHAMAICFSQNLFFFTFTRCHTEEVFSKWYYLYEPASHTHTIFLANFLLVPSLKILFSIRFH